MVIFLLSSPEAPEGHYGRVKAPLLAAQIKASREEGCCSLTAWNRGSLSASYLATIVGGRKRSNDSLT